MITRRQYQYLGDLGRYNKSRIEAGMLNALLQIDGDAPPKRLKNTKMTVRSQDWKLITELMKNTEIQQEEWPEKWRNVAQDGMLWKKLAEIEIKKVAVSAETSTWTEKHAEGSELLAPPPHKKSRRERHSWVREVREVRRERASKRISCASASMPRYRE